MNILPDGCYNFSLRVHLGLKRSQFLRQVELPVKADGQVDGFIGIRKNKTFKSNQRKIEMD